METSIALACNDNEDLILTISYGKTKLSYLVSNEDIRDLISCNISLDILESKLIEYISKELETKYLDDFRSKLYRILSTLKYRWK